MIREYLFIGGPWDGQTRDIEVQSYYYVRILGEPRIGLYNNSLPTQETQNIIRYRGIRLPIGTLDAYIYVAEGIQDEKVLNYILHSLQVRKWDDDS